MPVHLKFEDFLLEPTTCTHWLQHGGEGEQPMLGVLYAYDAG